MTGSLRDVFRYYSEMVVENMREILVSNRKFATGNLINSIQARFQKSNNVQGFTISMANYGSVVKVGRGAGKKQPPTDAIEAWLRVKKIPVVGGKGRVESMVKRTSPTIARKGARPENSSSIVSYNIKTRRGTTTTRQQKNIKTDSQIRSIAFVIARKIGRDGTKGVDFITQPMKILQSEQFKKDVAGAVIRDIKIIFK